MSLALFPIDEDPREAALIAARAEGCTCEPEVELVEIEPRVYVSRVAHDPWCVLLRRRDRN